MPESMRVTAERMQVHGRIAWNCVYCGYANRERLLDKHWRVRCNNSECRRVQTWAMHAVPSGNASRSAELTLALINAAAADSPSDESR